MTLVRQRLLGWIEDHCWSYNLLLFGIWLDQNSLRALPQQRLLAQVILQLLVLDIDQLVRTQNIVSLRTWQIILSDSINNLTLVFRYRVFMNILFENEGFVIILLHTWIITDLNSVVFFLVLRVAKLSCYIKARSFGGKLLLMVKVSDLSRA